jgi:peptidyl-prolyl cis-trans isomerase B (cyclophilin B)
MTVPTNEQRREAAKRKLERQLVRREERERGRRQRLIIIGVVAAVLVIGGGIWIATTRGGGSSTASSGTGTETAASSSAAPKTPCSYTTVGKAAKKVNKPSNLSPLNTGTVAATITLNGQKVDATLDRAAAPCTVNSFLSLASQKFYDGSPCWRLTGNSALNILQCGDPTGVGNGGPGYTFADELSKTKTYPKGTLAMANSGADTNGSQFFIVYKDSTLPAAYTVFGKISDAGMSVIQDIAGKGIKNNSQDGPPVAKAVIDSVSVPSDALTGTGTYASASASAAPSNGAPSGPTGTVSAPTAAPASK